MILSAIQNGKNAPEVEREMALCPRFCESPETPAASLAGRFGGRMTARGRLRIGISACLLGDRVRWDGDHERRDFLADVLGPRVEWVKACPELEAGLGVPREPIAFVRGSGGLRLTGGRSGTDMGPRLDDASARILASAGATDGWVLKARSPSCGPDGARVYATVEALRSDGPFERTARGRFADRLKRECPRLPAVDETMLQDTASRLHFVERCFVHRRVRALGEAPDPAAWRALHEALELQVLVRSAHARHTLSSCVRQGDSDPHAFAKWRALLAIAMAVPPIPSRVDGVLRRVALRLGTPAAAECVQAHEEEGAGLDVVRERLLAEARRAGDAVLLAETFLDPEPEERDLRRAIRGAGPAG